MVRKSTGLSGVPMSNPCGDSTHSVSVRPIENGFIVSESSYGNGDYRSSERYEKTAPAVPQIRPQTGSVGDEGLSGAIAECKS